MGPVALMVTISVFAALILYALVILSNIRLYRQKPALERPFEIPHPVVQGIAMVLVALLFLCVLITNLSALKWVVVVYAAASGYYICFGRGKTAKMPHD